MGKFSGVLLGSDFDNTLVYTAQAFSESGDLPPIPAYNLERLWYFVENGGSFSVLTGRAWVAFKHLIEPIPINAPCVLNNGTEIIDVRTGEIILSKPLDSSVTADLHDAISQIEGVAFEFYGRGEPIALLYPNDYSRRHIRITNFSTRKISSPDEVESPLLKITMDGPAEVLEKLYKIITAQEWFSKYELVYTGNCLMDLTPKGATKGAALEFLADYCNISMEHTYAVGDQVNDLSMLLAAKRGFAPKNSASQLFDSGAAVLRHCSDGAVGEVVDYLDSLYQ
ncbi:MAG: Cof-type HAD-IIB family hydrolase [Oscillospiraceae bacterium]|nr:Cof-type HAD-IIB family hydrolase [Oscillospiraceae bacterium]